MSDADAHGGQTEMGPMFVDAIMQKLLGGYSAEQGGLAHLTSCFTCNLCTGSVEVFGGITKAVFSLSLD